MSSVDVIKCCLDSIRQISDEIKDSIVYLDAGSTESFQFIGAFSLFMELGALSVCNLENMSSLDKVGHSAYPDSPLGPDAYQEYGSLLTQDYEELVKKQNTIPSLSETNELKETAASEEEGWSELTSISDEVSGFGSNSSLAVTSLGYVEDRRKKLMVSLHHFPLILCPLSPRVFVLPSEGSIAEACLSSEHENSISYGLPASSTRGLADAEDVNPGAALTAQFLYQLASKMDLKLEIFSLGDLSKNVGKLLTDMSSLYDVGRRKRSAGLLLIDRTLDLLTPCCHGDSLVDRFFSSLPRRNRTTSSSQMRASQSQIKTGPVKLERARLDIQIPFDKFLREENSTFRLLESVEAFLHGWKISDSDSHIAELVKFSKKMNNERSSFDLLHGSFVATDNFRGAPYLEAMLDRRTKDGAMLIKKWLQESLRKENISLDVKIRPGNPSKSDLQALVKALGKTQSSLIKNKGIVQLASAAIHALDESNSASWDAFNSAEKILHVNAGDTSQSLAAQITDLVNKSALEKTKGIFALNDALLLTVVGYILAGDNFPSSGSPFSWQEEHFMKDAIVDAILENPDVSELKFLEGLSLELEDNINKTTSDSKKEDIDSDDDQWGNWGDDEEGDSTKDKKFNNMQLKLELRDRVDNLFKYFHKLASMKRIMPRREGMLNGDPYSSKGLVYKLLRSILDKKDVPGLEYHSSTVGRLFKSGFGRFGLGQAKPSLAEQDVILVFVIGGINGVEVREAQEALTESSKPDTEMILGGTTFLTPNNMRELLLGDYGHV